METRKIEPTIMDVTYEVINDSSDSLSIGFDSYAERFVILHTLSLSEDERNSYKLSTKKHDFSQG